MKKVIKKSFVRYQSGAALLEAIIALSAVVVAVAGIAVVITASVSNSQFVQDQNMANKYAQEGMEYLKSEKEKLGYDQFIGTYYGVGGSKCFNEDFQRSPDVGDCKNERVGNNKFVRKITVSDSVQCAGVLDGYLAKITVNWQSSKCNVLANTFCHSAELATCITQTSFSNMTLEFDPTPTPAAPHAPFATATPTPRSTATPTPR
ncbi:MAG TPA: hypothetical protein PLD54_04015, partial [Candidatus Levybacteria bacterium]|nr:hypothetical protein [Candidatus Levybacteria bacterium]